MSDSQRAGENCSVNRQLTSTLDEKEPRENYKEKKAPEKSLPDRQWAHHSETHRLLWQRLSPIIKRHFSHYLLMWSHLTRNQAFIRALKGQQRE